MKKLITGMMLSLMIFIGLSSTVYAGEDVSKAFNMYTAMKEAKVNNDLVAMENLFNELEEVIYNFDDNQSEEWGKLIEENVGLEEFLTTLFQVGYVIDVDDCREKFINDKNAKTAMDFVENYKEALEIEAPIETMLLGIKDVYSEAQAYIPDEDVKVVYALYTVIKDTLELQDVFSVEDVIQDFEEYLDKYNEFSEEQFKQLAELMGLEDAQEAYSVILSDWIDINIFNTVMQAYETFGNKPDKETAKNFVEVYEGIFKDSSYEDKDMKNYIREIYGDIDECYKEAKKYSLLYKDNNIDDNKDSKNDDTSKENVSDVEKLEHMDNTPKTGDMASMVIWMIMIGVSLTMMLAISSRKVRYN
ncbi:MAG: hypothetical protein E7262_11055 [Lachnospiraceae bacterium]|nr:hypothetical protein [Lachnospiraceae bacterium]